MGRGGVNSRTLPKQQQRAGSISALKVVISSGTNNSLNGI